MNGTREELMSEVERLRARVEELTHLPEQFGGLHESLDDCPTFMDGCHCTVATLKHNIYRAKTLEAKLAQALEEIKELRNHPLRVDFERQDWDRAERWVAQLLVSDIQRDLVRRDPVQYREMIIHEMERHLCELLKKAAAG